MKKKLAVLLAAVLCCGILAPIQSFSADAIKASVKHRKTVPWLHQVTDQGLLVYPKGSKPMPFPTNSHPAVLRTKARLVVASGSTNVAMSITDAITEVRIYVSPENPAPRVGFTIQTLSTNVVIAENQMFTDGFSCNYFTAEGGDFKVFKDDQPFLGGFILHDGAQFGQCFNGSVPQTKYSLIRQ